MTPSTPSTALTASNPSTPSTPSTASTPSGHGEITNNDELVFFANDAFPRSFRYDQTLNPLFPNFADISLSKVDAVTILDACHVGIATRSPGQIEIGRAAEVVAAVQADQYAFSRKQGRISFTLKLATEIAFRRRRGDASVSFVTVRVLIGLAAGVTAMKLVTARNFVLKTVEFNSNGMHTKMYLILEQDIKILLHFPMKTARPLNSWMAFRCECMIELVLDKS